MEERLQKILSRAGITSRRRAEELITAGRVAVNGQVVTELGTKADPDRDSITLDGKKVSHAVPGVYILLYKPSGYMTTLKDPEGRPLVTDLLKEVPERVYPVGRLDYNTEGLLLLTNDGAWANALAHPSHEVDKGYHVRIRGRVTEEQLRKLAAGVDLEDGKTAPAAVSLVRESESNTWLSIIIHEGRYRQVRRMCEAVGLSVVRLKRVSYAFLNLEGLRPGEHRSLTRGEVEHLRRMGGGGKPAQEVPDSQDRRKDRGITDKPMAGKTREKPRDKKIAEKARDNNAQDKGFGRQRTGGVPERPENRRRKPRA
jgi:23S rRNA pseudouridine2605 synthase